MPEHPIRPLTLSPDSYTELPPGWLAAAVTYLEMTAPAPPRPAPERPDLRFVRLRPDRDPAALADYRALYDAIGRDLLWFSRAGLSEASLASLLTRDGVEVWIARRDDGRAVGLVEFDGHDDIEIVYFGLVPDAIGGGAGRWLMSHAINRAFARPIRRLWLHTCHFDHPNALDFYRRSGFRPYRFGIELARDPRLTGRLPRDAAPQIPLIDPAEPATL